MKLKMYIYLSIFLYDVINFCLITKFHSRRGKICFSKTADPGGPAENGRRMFQGWKNHETSFLLFFSNSILTAKLFFFLFLISIFSFQLTKV